LSRGLRNRVKVDIIYLIRRYGSQQGNRDQVVIKTDFQTDFKPVAGGLAPRMVMTVSELTEKIKALLENKFSIIWIKGEISNFKIASSGHAYLTLKDEKAQISAVLFRGQLRQLGFDPADGMQILGLGRISVYPPRGNYQVILEYLEPKGVGSLQLAFEKLKQKLMEEGLFDQRHKKPLPFLVKNLCVITSAQGAVIKDIINVATRRFPRLEIDLIPVNVQGAESAAQIVQAIEMANRHGRADVILIARGGGSFEDLAPFNDEEVARAIFASEIPVVSAVGHEVDFTIADFVADLRAPTPSAAAEIIVPVYAEIELRLQELIYRMETALAKLTSFYRHQIEQLGERLIHPAKRLSENFIKIDDLTKRLVLSWEFFLAGRRQRLQDCLGRLRHNSPLLRLKTGVQELLNLKHRAAYAMQELLAGKLRRLDELTAALNALNPTAILKRGYSIVLRKDDLEIVTSSNQVADNQHLYIWLADGRLEAVVAGRDVDIKTPEIKIPNLQDGK